LAKVLWRAGWRFTLNQEPDMHAWKFLFVVVIMIGGMPGLPSVWAEDAVAPLNSGAQPVAGQGLQHAQAAFAPDENAPVEAAVKRHNGPKTQTDKIVEKFMTLDVDGSAGVSMDEYITIVQQRVMARFAAMDADKNGEVTEDEYRAFWKSRMAKWYRLKR